MKLASLVLFCFSTLLLFGCREGGTKTELSVPATENLTRKLVEENTFIDVDLRSIAENQTSLTRSEEHSEDVCRVKAAFYRFYQNVTVVDGYYHCSVEKASEINLSDELFSALLENLKEMNAEMKKLRDSGEEISIKVPDKVYLESLLE
ncbi:MAG: hypothetical protein K2H57_07055 [Duncaniella sp.]|nr:hypothetical protein [Duncaniella sp.]